MATEALDSSLRSVLKGIQKSPTPTVDRSTLSLVSFKLVAVDQSDSPPASQLIEVFGEMCRNTQAALARWNEVRTQDIPRLNGVLGKASVAGVTAPRAVASLPDCGN